MTFEEMEIRIARPPLGGQMTCRIGPRVWQVIRQPNRLRLFFGRSRKPRPSSWIADLDTPTDVISRMCEMAR